MSTTNTTKPITAHRLWIGTHPDPDKRLRLDVSKDDYNRIPTSGTPGKVTVTDLRTNRRLIIRDADCGAGCRCALALVRWLDDAPQPPEHNAGLRDEQCRPTDRRCEDHPSRSIYRCGYCESDLEHQKHAAQLDTGQPGRETQTSELPWTLGKNSDKCAENHAICSGPAVIAKVYGRGYPIGSGWSPRSEADAKLIVTAVNSHKSLIAALERTQRFLLLLTDAGVLDQIAAELSSPDEVNGLCDAVGEALKHAREGE